MHRMCQSVYICYSLHMMEASSRNSPSYAKASVVTLFLNSNDKWNLQFNPSSKSTVNILSIIRFIFGRTKFLLAIRLEHESIKLSNLKSKNYALARQSSLVALAIVVKVHAGSRFRIRSISLIVLNLANLVGNGFIKRNENSIHLKMWAHTQYQ